MSKKVILTIVILVLLAGIIGILIYNKSKSTSQPQPTPTPNPTYIPPKNSPNPTPNPTPTPPAVDLTDLFGQFPTSSTTQAQKDVFNQKVRTMAKTSSTLEITNCVPNPSIMMINMKTPFTIKNNDGVERQLTHSEFTLTVPANSQKQITPAFKGEGAYGYRCGGNLVGIFYIIP